LGQPLGTDPESATIPDENSKKCGPENSRISHGPEDFFRLGLTSSAWNLVALGMANAQGAVQAGSREGTDGAGNGTRGRLSTSHCTRARFLSLSG
jgi:hypothetical protein